MRVHDDTGKPFDATVNLAEQDGQFSITFESRGGGRNMDYIPAFRTVLARLARMRALLTDARLVTGETRHLPVEQRRLVMRGITYPVSLEQQDSMQVASLLRTAQGDTARKPGAKGSGNRTKRTELVFLFPEGASSFAFVAERVLNPTGGIEVVALTEYVRPRAGGRGQGFLSNAEDRLLAEKHSMSSAIEYFKNLGATVEDVSRYECFDLRCTLGDTVFDVEVKGTTTTGKSILLTANEVDHAKKRFPHIVLYVLSEITIHTVDAVRIASGGKVAVHRPWRLDDSRLKAETFSLALA